MRDIMGHMVVYIVYDRHRKTADGGWWRVATFRDEGNAKRFLDEQANSNLFISCGRAAVADLRMARD